MSDIIPSRSPVTWSEFFELVEVLDFPLVLWQIARMSHPSYGLNFDGQGLVILP
jgi:hypothetical protein